jgi:hypothetical protein
MYEHGQTWTIIGDDGTTVILDGGGASDSVFRLEQVTGFDGPNVRQNIEELPELDGAIAGDFFFGARPVTFRGRIIASTAADRNFNVTNLQRALRGLRGDVTLKSQASGLPAMQATARLEQPLRVTGGYVKEFLIALVCPDPRMYSQTLNSSSATGVATVPGAAFPWAFPVSFGGGTGQTLTLSVTNAGNFDTPPILRVTGPLRDPIIRNSTPAQVSIGLGNVVLGSGNWIEIDMGARTVVRDDGVSLYDRVGFPGTDWWQLVPGSNTVDLFASDTTAATTLTVTWRDSWV